MRRGGAVLEGRIVQMFGMNVSSEQEQQKLNFFMGLGEVGSTAETFRACDLIFSIQNHLWG